MSDKDDDDGLFDENNNDSSDEEIAVSKNKKKPSKKRKISSGGGDAANTNAKASKKPTKQSWIDDAAEESGEEGGGSDDDEEEDDDENENDYVKDGFVVDEDEVERVRKKKSGDLEDSDDDEDNDDDDDDDDGPAARKKRFKKSRVRKMRTLDRLAEEDLDLIREARGDKDREESVVREREEARRKAMARNDAELRKGLFYDSGEEDATAAAVAKPRKNVPERYDEDGMDDFIDDDIGDQGQILANDRRAAYDEEKGGVSEAQLNEASEIFGTDYLDFMAQEGHDDGDQEEENLFGKGKYRERGVGVDLGVDSEEDISDDDEDDDDDDLFGDDDADGVSSHQKAEALKLKRQKKEMSRQERRRKAQLEKNSKRKAQLRRAFEPVQLVENFCTDRDDEIRRLDAPERFFDWTTPFHGASGEEISEEEEEQAFWIMGKIPDIASEYFSVSDEEGLEVLEQRQKSITDSIVHALRYMHNEKLEPAFIKRYRKDVVASPSVRENIYNIMDEDGEWDRMISARTKVESVLTTIAASVQGDEAVGAETESLKTLEANLKTAQAKLEESAAQESEIKIEMEELGPADDDAMDEDDDDELFGDDDEDESKAAKKKQKERLESHLSTVQTLLQDRAEKVATLETQVLAAQSRNDDSLKSHGPALQVTKKICRQNLWNTEDTVEYLSGLTDVRHILDVSGYLNLIKEGNDAIRKKEIPSLDEVEKKKDDRKRSRRFDRDFYRTCVSEGLRNICYRFLLSPHRVGIKLEEILTSPNRQFDFMRAMPGEEGTGGPQKWVPPTIPSTTPSDFATELVGSGELVRLSSSNGETDEMKDDEDPLRGCRYVAAMELAYEPRVRRHLRNIYRRHAVLTTRPTKKGIETIDAFHDYFGLHLIRNKPVKEHFPMDERESAEKKALLGPEERKDLDTEMKNRERDSCLQYLNLLKAEKTGDVSVCVHLPFVEQGDDWYNQDDMFTNRERQDLRIFTDELERVYFPLDGDTEEWNKERRLVLKQAVLNFLLPQFEAEIRREIREAAVKVGVVAASENLHDMAMEGPYRPQYLAHTENRFLHPTGDLPMVGICCSLDNKEATYLASVTERGELNDHFAIPGGTRVDSGKFREKVINFLIQSRPAAVIIGTSGGFESRVLTRKMTELVNEAVKSWADRGIQGDDEDEEDFLARQEVFRQMMPAGHYDDDDEDMIWKCNVDLVDDSVAQLFGRSVRGKKEFPDHAVNLKCAVAIARYAKDPLAEVTYAWGVASDTGNFGAEMLYLNIHPMQQLLPKILLLRHYERTLCEVVAEVGTDINTSSTFDHLHGLLSFIPGLGPRKAANIKQSLMQMGGAVGSRRSLLEKRLMGPIVYNNSCAFLRIREVDQLTNQFLHPLDDTRLHPDVYHRNNWAVKIAVDALERAEDDAKNKELAGIKALRDVMDNSSQEVERLFNATKQEWEGLYGPTFNVADWNPRLNVPSDDQWRDKVEELDLETFAEMIEQNGLGRWHSHLQMIKWEFRLPFADPRKPMEPLTGDKLFKLVTGETDQSMRPGKEVTGKVVRNGDFGSRIKLEGDIPAFIPLRNLADEHVEAAEDVVAVGMVVTAVVTEVKKDHMCVDLSLKMEDFRRLTSSWERPQTLPPLDDHFDRTAASTLEDKKTKEREARLEALHLSVSTTRIGEDEDGMPKKRMGRVTRRACTHPAFRNARNDEVDRELKEAGAAMVGEALIRPSSKSSDSLAIHWVVREDVIKVIEVLEADKDTDASIGNILKIKDDTYGSIDELLGRYIAPMNDFVEELTNNRKFVDLPEDELDEKLRAQKTASPAGVFYNVCWMEMHPGYASLRFILSATARHHPVGISPNGFAWGAKVHPSLDSLLNEFKKNPRGTSTAKRTAAKLPPPKPADSGAAKPSRWGNKPPAPPAPPAWGSAPPAPAPPVAGWGVAQASGAQWNQPPPPNMPPPPSGYGAPPNQPPPPSFGRPPPPGPPPSYQQTSDYQYQPPPPPGYPPRV